MAVILSEYKIPHFWLMRGDLQIKEVMKLCIIKVYANDDNLGVP